MFIDRIAKWGRWFLIGSFLLSGAVYAAADTTYQYIGNPYNYFSGYSCPPVCSITATVDLASAIAPDTPLTSVTPVSFSISDGLTTIVSPDTGYTQIFEFGTDAYGDIDSWYVAVGDCCTGGWGVVLNTRNDPGNTGVIDWSFTNGPEAWVSNDRGTWTEVPEPGTLALLATGLLGFAGAARRRVLR